MQTACLRFTRSTFAFPSIISVVTKILKNIWILLQITGCIKKEMPCCKSKIGTNQTQRCTNSIIFSSKRSKIIRFSILLRPPGFVIQEPYLFLAFRNMTSRYIRDGAIVESKLRLSILPRDTTTQKWLNDLFVLYQHVSDMKLLWCSFNAKTVGLVSWAKESLSAL